MENKSPVCTVDEFIEKNLHYLSNEERLRFLSVRALERKLEQLDYRIAKYSCGKTGEYYG